MSAKSGNGVSSGTARQQIRAAALLSKDGSKAAEDLRRAMCRWFDERRVACVSFNYDPDSEDFFDLVRGVDVVVALGGDGTFVSIARKLAPAPMPIIGVNLGRVGFLAEICPESWESSFERMLELGVVVEKSLALRYVLLRGGETLLEGLAANDLVVSRGGPARLVSLTLAVDDIRLAVLRADGLIVSSPTGSTGYTGSARGPLLHPVLAAYAVTPICPFMSNFLPMVVDCKTCFSITVEDAGPEIFLTVDGQESLELCEGDVLNISGKENSIHFARIDNEGYYAKLRFAGFVRDFPA